MALQHIIQHQTGAASHYWRISEIYLHSLTKTGTETIAKKNADAFRAQIIELKHQYQNKNKRMIAKRVINLKCQKEKSLFMVLELSSH